MKPAREGYQYDPATHQWRETPAQPAPAPAPEPAKD